MTESEIEEKIAKIKDSINDDEGAHSQEDALYRELLQSIAEGTCVNPQACARIALTTQELAFARWCA